MPSAIDLLATTNASGVTSVVLGTGSSSLSSYRYIDIYGTAFFSTNGGADGIKLQFNGDTGNNYSSAYYEQSVGGTIGWGSGINEISLWCAYRPSGTGTKPIHFFARIFNHNLTNRKKQTQNRFGNYDEGYQGTYNTRWNNTSAVTSITLISATGTNMQAGTNFQVYGIKG